MNATVLSHESILGREDEIAALEALFANDAGALLIEGQAGIGKTTLWRAGLRLARAHGFRVLATTPLRSQAQFAYGGVGDLCSGSLGRLGELPAPQRRALATALLLEEHEGVRVEPRAVAVGLLGLLALLTEEGPVLVAIDDIQWLDRASALALEHALQRLIESQLHCLFALRIEEGTSAPWELERLFPEESFGRLVLGGLRMGALQRLVRERLGVAFSHRTLRRLHELTGGNPFFALEVARELHAHEAEPAPGEPLPVPADVRRLVRRRLRRMPASSRDALLAAAMLRHPTTTLLEEALFGCEDALEEPLLLGIVELAGSEIRFSHPLFASGIHALVPPRRRRELHARLADLPLDLEERAEHAALAAEGPDARIAKLLEAAAGRARTRGAGAVAAGLYGQAAALTPPGETDALQRRVVAQGECLLETGEQKAACRLLEQLIETMQPGPPRAWLSALLEVWLLDYVHLPSRLRTLLAEASGDPAAEAFIARELCANEPTRGDFESALRYGRHAVACAEAAGDQPVLGQCLTTLAHIEICAGVPAASHLERALAICDRLPETLQRNPWEQPRFIMGLQALLAGELTEARGLLEPIYECADTEERAYSLAFAIAYLVELEWRAGAWGRAAELAGRCLTLVAEVDQAMARAGLLRCSALVAAGLGRLEEARTLARRSIEAADAVGWREDRLLSSWLLGFVELSQGNTAAAAAAAPRPADIALLFGPHGNPGAFPFWADAVESLVETGALERAEELTHWLERSAPGLDHPYRDAVSARCRGLCATARGDHEAAIQELEKSAGRFRTIGMPFEQGRSLLALGIAQRRTKQRRAARESFLAARSIFERLPAPLWAAQTERESLRVAGRAPRAAGELTPTEERVVRLVVEGLSNKQVAARLFVTVRTVEFTLTHVYAKLGIRSRGELAARLLARSNERT